MSSLSNRNANNTRFITLVSSSLASSLKVQSTLNSVIRGVLLLVRFLVYKRLTRYFKLVAVIFLFSKIIFTYSRYMEKELIYIIIITLFSCQLSSCTKYIRLNIYLFCDIRSVFNAKYIFLTCYYTY